MLAAFIYENIRIWFFAIGAAAAGLTGRDELARQMSSTIPWTDPSLTDVREKKRQSHWNCEIIMTRATQKKRLCIAHMASAAAVKRTALLLPAAHPQFVVLIARSMHLMGRQKKRKINLAPSMVSCLPFNLFTGKLSERPIRFSGSRETVRFCSCC